jgi:hypothetical protein
MLAAIVRIRSKGPMPPAIRFWKADAVTLATGRRFLFLSAISQIFS